MKLHLFEFFRSPSQFQNNRNKTRWMEWFIAILFVVTLLIGSGVFVKASNAADLKIQQHGKLAYRELETVPGAMRVLKAQEPKSSPVVYMESEDSCELKIKQ